MHVVDHDDAILLGRLVFYAILTLVAALVLGLGVRLFLWAAF